MTFLKSFIFWILIVSIGLFSFIALSYKYYTAQDFAAANSGTDYHVSIQAGLDTNPGTSSNPFKTIQRCADELLSASYGSRCTIREGVYRETVTIKDSGQLQDEFVFTAYPGETVIISGRDTITSEWTKVSQVDYPHLPSDHNVYATTLNNWDFDQLEGMDYAMPGSGQLFVHDTPYQMAAEPDLQPDYMASIENWAEHDPRNRTAAQHSQGVNTDWVYFAKNQTPQDIDENGTAFTSEFELTSKSPLLDAPAGYWDGAMVNFLTGQRWDVMTGKVLSSDSGTFNLSIGAYSNNMFFPIGLEGRHYVWNTPKALTTAGEWSWSVDRSSAAPKTTVLFWAPYDQDPNFMNISAKKRLFGVDFQDYDFITLDGINFDTTTTNSKIAYNNFGANSPFINRLDVDQTNSSEHVVLRNFWARYPSHFTYNRANYRASAMHNASTGVMLHGIDHVIEQCYVTFSSGNGITINGDGGNVNNCLVSNTGYGGADTGGIRTGGLNLEIHNHTVWHTGRHAYLFGNIGSNVNFTHPNSGSVYGICTADSRFHHNVGYNSGAHGSNDLGTFYGWNGRDDCNGLEIDHNIMYNTNVRSLGHAIYLDNNATDTLVHHNVSWGSLGLRLNFENKRNQVYHDTDIAINKQTDPEIKLFNYGPTSADKHYVKNNIFTTIPELFDCDPSSTPGQVFTCVPSPCESYGEFITDPSNPNETICVHSENGNRFELSHNKLLQWQDFTDPAERDYSLLPTANDFIDQGTTLTGSLYGYDLSAVQNNVIDGQPDIGAFENGAPNWEAGTVLYPFYFRYFTPDCQVETSNMARCSIALITPHLLTSDVVIDLKIGQNPYSTCSAQDNQLLCDGVDFSDNSDTRVWVRLGQEEIDTGTNVAQ